MGAVWAGNRGPIVDNRMGSVLGVVVGTAVIGYMRRIRVNL